MVLPTLGTAICRVHSAVVLACVAASNGDTRLDVVVSRRCRGEQRQNTFACFLHQFNRCTVCHFATMVASSAETDTNRPICRFIPSWP